MKKSVIPEILLISLVIITGCATSNTSITVKRENDKGAVVSKLLVLALTGIDENKETGEKELVYWLRQSNYDATASFDVLPVRGRLPVKEEVRRVMEQHDFDGVLAMRLLDVDENSRYVSSSEKGATSVNETYFYNYLNAWRGNYDPGYYSNARIMVIESNLYIFPEAEIVYSTVSESFVSDSFETFANDFSKAMTKSLKNSGVLKEK